ncbi:MAG TPA: hypothetical protein VHP55_13465 [Usitatibacter sp.]|nr:hypothetical protein [Usitatibacter sp.]
MKYLRSLAICLWLAAVLVVGQQLAALHDLSHATEQLSEKGGKPGTTACELCVACAGMTGAPGAHVPTVPEPACTAERAPQYCAEGAQPAPFLNFRSRAPPTLI